MWAHYGDNHKGVCLEFDATIAESTIRINPVVYNSESIPAIDKMDDYCPKILLRKDEEWGYENEWRIIARSSIPMMTEPVTHEFKKRSLTGIYFGCRVKSKDIDDIRARMMQFKSGDDSYQHVKFQQVKYQSGKIQFITLDGLI
ncbi:MAG: DUF2971 domain-containing protein [Chitinophagaceae bacterium]